MAEYMDRKDAILLIENYRHNVVKTSKQLHQNDMADALVKDLYHNIPIADVVEREKIDKAIEEIEERIKYSKLPTVNRYNTYSEGLKDCLDILKRNIGE